MKQSLRWTALALAAVLCLGMCAPALAAEDGADAQALIDQGMDAWNAGDMAAALELMTEAAEQGNPDAQEIVGEFYEEDYGVVDADCAQAVEWYEKAADLGSATAMANLAEMYEKGKGVDADPDMARELYEKAAALGEVHAQAWLEAQGENGGQ